MPNSRPDITTLKEGLLKNLPKYADKFHGGIFCPRTVSLDGDILLMHCQMQTGFLIQLILHLLLQLCCVLMKTSLEF